MRIIAGKWRGRRLQSPTGNDTRPTTDRVRESLFSSLHSRIGSFEGLRVLDAFAGSGALGLEALSRGADFLAAVENNPASARLVEDNYDLLTGTGTGTGSSTSPVGDGFAGTLIADSSDDDTFRLYRGDIFKVTTRLANLAIDLAFFDPPYDFTDTQISELLQTLAQNRTFAYGALIVIERAKRHKKAPREALLPEGFTLLAEKAHGDTVLVYASFAP